jgi:hypothetical protein
VKGYQKIDHRDPQRPPKLSLWEPKADIWISRDFQNMCIMAFGTKVCQCAQATAGTGAGRRSKSEVSPESECNPACVPSKRRSHPKDVQKHFKCTSKSSRRSSWRLREYGLGTSDQQEQKTSSTDTPVPDLSAQNARSPRPDEYPGIYRYIYI